MDYLKNISEHSLYQKQNINGSINAYLTILLEIEEVNTRIENLIKIREELKKAHQKNDTIIHVSYDTESLDEKFLNKLTNYIKSNLGNNEINVSSIMTQMHISRTQLHRKLKTLTGLSITEFIRTIRLKKAEQLLKQNADSVTQIGYQIGFSDHSYFSKCFKKEYGVSPSQYSKSHQLF